MDGQEMFGQFNREKSEDIDKKKIWRWLQKSDLKPETEALICIAQERALRTNYIKFNIDKTVDSPLCHLCWENGQSLGHLISECTKFAEREYKRRHNNVARIIHWSICGKHNLERTNKWYEHAPRSDRIR